MYELGIIITITAAHLRLFVQLKEQDPTDCITVQSSIQLKTAGGLPESISPLQRGLSFT